MSDQTGIPISTEEQKKANAEKVKPNPFILTIYGLSIILFTAVNWRFFESVSAHMHGQRFLATVQITSRDSDGRTPQGSSGRQVLYPDFYHFYPLHYHLPAEANAGIYPKSFDVRGDIVGGFNHGDGLEVYVYRSDDGIVVAPRDLFILEDTTMFFVSLIALFGLLAIVGYFAGSPFALVSTPAIAKK